MDQFDFVLCHTVATCCCYGVMSEIKELHHVHAKVNITIHIQGEKPLVK